MLISHERERSMANLIDVGKEYPLFLCVCVCVCVCRKEGQLDKLLANGLPPQCVIYPSNLIKDFSDLSPKLEFNSNSSKSIHA